MVRWRGQSHKPSTVVRYRRPLWEVVSSAHRQNGRRLVPTHGSSPLQEEGEEGNCDHAVDGGATVAEYEHVYTALDGGTGHGAHHGRPVEEETVVMTLTIAASMLAWHVLSRKGCRCESGN